MKTSGILTAILVLAISPSAYANSFDGEGTVLESSHGYAFQGDRHLVPDGSFEEGLWSVVSSNNCDWIVDLVPLGLWNYDGSYVAWLGGFCQDVATGYTHICQTMIMETYCPPGLSWYWMGYINEGGSRVYLTIGEDVVWEKILTPDDHMNGYQIEYVEIPLDYSWTEQEVCFNYERSVSYGDNYFLDYVEFTGLGLTPFESLSFSTVKSLY